MESKQISKLISYWLRHKPEEAGLNLDEYGNSNIDEVLSALATKGNTLTVEDLLSLNESFDKKRWLFDLEKNTMRASHGHSIKIKQILAAESPPNKLYHGTAISNIDSIFKNGLQKMNREFVHLSSNRDDALKVGGRHGKPVLIEIDSKALANNGFKFYKSENDIWLCDDIQPIHLEVIS